MKKQFLVLMSIMLIGLMIFAGCGDSSKASKDDDKDDDKDDTRQEAIKDDLDDEDEIDDIADALDKITEQAENSDNDNPISMASGAYEFSTFVNMAEDVSEELSDVLSDTYPDDYFDYMGMEMGLANTIFMISGYELAYTMDSMNLGATWEDVNDEWPNGSGSTISTFSVDGGVYRYIMDDVYVDNDNTSATYITYDSNKDAMSAYHDFQDTQGYSTSIMYTEYCSDGQGGFYAQHFNSLPDANRVDIYSYYITENTCEVYHILIDDAEGPLEPAISLLDQVPSSAKDLIASFGEPDYIHFDGNEATYLIQD